MRIPEFAHRWWTDGQEYTWFSGFLDRQRLAGFARWWLATCCAALGLFGFLFAFCASGPRSTSGVAAVVVLSLTAFYAALRWARYPWPTERQSVLFLCWTEIALAAVLVAGASSPAVAVGGSAVFLTTGMYISMLHRPLLLLPHYAWALCASGVATWRGVVTEPPRDPVLVTALIVIVVAFNVLVPLVLHVLVHFLKKDAEESLLDPLTRLSNRRGLTIEADILFRSAVAGRDPVATLLIDLDGFKARNDDYGHAVGDRVLCAIAARLRSAAPPGSVLARLGGDEFAVVVQVPDDVAVAVHQSIFATIHNELDEVPVTASVGVWTYEPSAQIDGIDIDYALARADTAMYEAKRNGGNQLISVREPADPAPSSWQ